MNKETLLKKIGKNVTRLREQANLSQTELALRCDKDKQSLNRLEKGRINPSVFYLHQIAQELNATIKELVDIAETK